MEYFVKKNMQFLFKDIEIISAPSILGLKPGGVELLSEKLLTSGLTEKLKTSQPVIHVPTQNDLYQNKRDPYTNCLNVNAIKDFSQDLKRTISGSIQKNHFPVVLGGDCNILIGIMPALKAKGTYGLIFLDAHADFYEPEKSTTGEEADMDLAIITGRGPEILTNIDHLKPYVKDEHVIHIGQRDFEETKKYGSRDIQKTAIKCLSFSEIEKKGMNEIISEMLQYINLLDTNGFWIHFDTDVLSDEINPAVDYRLPGGLQFDQVEHLLQNLLSTGKMAGISITIFNPWLDTTGSISKNLSESIGKSFFKN